MRRVLRFALLVPCAVSLRAQAPSPAPVPAMAAPVAPAGAGPVTGIAGVQLPPGFAQSRNVIWRLAAKAELAITARNAKQKLGDGYEAWRLPASAGTATLATVAASLQQQGWTVTPIGASTTDAWIERAGTRVLLIARADAQESWVYLQPAQAAPAAAVMVAGDPGAVAPPAASQAPVASAPVASAPVAPTRPAMPTAPATPRQFRHARSNFDDGWTAYEGTAGVKAEKGPLTAWLFTARAVAPSPDGVTPGDQLWTTDVGSWFTPRTIARRTGTADGAPLAYVEAEGTVNATGQPAFVAMAAAQPGNVGIYRTIVLVGPDKATVQAAYATPEAMVTLLQYNKFAVDASDLAGRWQERGEWKMQLAYANPALLQGEPVTAELTFLADGRYTSREVARDANGAAVERTSSGTWSLTSPWTLVFTTPQGSSNNFDVQFELVEGGRVLHLVMQSDRRVQYHMTLAGAP